MTVEPSADNVHDPFPRSGIDEGSCCFRARQTSCGERMFACRAGEHRTCALHLYIDAEGRAHCASCMAQTSHWPTGEVTMYRGTNRSDATDERPTALIVPHALHMCGTARHCLEIAEEFSGRGFRVTVVAVQGGGHWGHKFLRVADEVVLGTPSMTWDDLATAMGERAPAFVTAHYDPAIAWAVRNVPVSVPAYAHFHTEPVPASGMTGLLADATRRCKRVFFPSVQTLRQYRELLPAKKSDRLAVMPNALPRALSTVGAADRARSMVAGARGTRLAVVSRLDPDKFSVALFIAAVRALRDVVPTLAVRVAGTGEAHSAVRRASRDAGLDAFVEYLGYVEDIADVYLTSDAVFIPSYTEAMPYTAIEAAAVGVPCVVPRIGYFAGPGHDLPGVATFEPEDHDRAFELLRDALRRKPPFDRTSELPLELRHETWSQQVAMSYELGSYLDPRPEGNR